MKSIDIDQSWLNNPKLMRRTMRFIGRNIANTVDSDIVFEVDFEAMMNKIDEILEIDKDLGQSLIAIIAWALAKTVKNNRSFLVKELIDHISKFEPKVEVKLYVDENSSSSEVNSEEKIKEIPKFTKEFGISASEFLIKYYGNRIASREIFQHHIRNQDPKLMTALDNEFRGKRSELRELLPTKSAETDYIIERHNVAIERSSTRSHLVAALRKARQLGLE